MILSGCSVRDLRLSIPAIIPGNFAGVSSEFCMDATGSELCATVLRSSIDGQERFFEGHDFEIAGHVSIPFDLWRAYQ